MKKSTLLTSLLLAGSFVASPVVLADPGHGKAQYKQEKTGNSNKNTIKMIGKKTNATTRTMIETATEATIDTTIVVRVAT